MQNTAPIETHEADPDSVEGRAPIRGMIPLTQSKMHAVPPPAAPEQQQPVVLRRSALVIEILAFVMIAFLVVSALLFNLTAPRPVVASQPAVSLQLPPVAPPAAGPAPAASLAPVELHPAPDTMLSRSEALTDVQPQAGTDAVPQADTSAAALTPEPPAPEASAPAPQAEVAALPPADEPIAPDATPAATPPAPTGETASIALPADEIATLIRRGDQLLGTGDIVAARSAYERAAVGGDRAAAMGVAKTYDPIFLAQSGVRGLRGNPARAALWYARAAAAGDRTAQQRLRQLRAQYPQ